MADCDQNKVFVGGISWETTEDVLREHFGKYGKVMEAVIANDRITGTSRGFAFVVFSEASALNEVLRVTHTILGRTVEVKKAVRRNNGVISSNNNLNIKKIFVGGLPANITEDEFRVYFEKFGKFTDVVVMHDNITRRPRGFGFITFDSEDSVEEVMRKSFHELCGKLVEVKRAVPKEDGGNGIGNYYLGGNGIGNYCFGGNGIGNYLLCTPGYDVAPIYGYGGGGGYYGLGPWGPYQVTVYPGYMDSGYGLMGMGGNGYNYGFLGFMSNVNRVNSVSNFEISR